ncbi:MAG: hypothetical protein HY430_02450 [Candidatus Levybacteria bacterium]|nr:hypothetical protein [Candidatus Levybacteria bacterium]
MAVQETRPGGHKDITMLSRAALLKETSDSGLEPEEKAHNRFLHDLATNNNVVGVAYLPQGTQGRGSRLGVLLREVGVGEGKEAVPPPVAVGKLTKSLKRRSPPVSYIIVGNHSVEDIVAQQSAGAINGTQPRVILFS